MKIRRNYVLLTFILGSVRGYGHHRLRSSLGGNQINSCGSNYFPEWDPFQICAVNPVLKRVQTFSSGTEMRNWNLLYCNAADTSNYFVKIFNGPCSPLSTLEGTAGITTSTTASVTPSSIANTPVTTGGVSTGTNSA